MGKKKNCNHCGTTDDKCLCQLVTAYGKISGQLVELQGEILLDIDGLCLSCPDKMERTEAVIFVTQFYLGSLLAAIEQYKACDNQKCCKAFVSSLNDLTIGLFKGFSKAILAGTLVNPIIFFYTRGLDELYMELFRQLGCEYTPIGPETINEQVKEKIKNLNSKSLF